MASIAQFSLPEPPMTDFALTLQQSHRAIRIGQLLSEAREAYGYKPLHDPRETGEMLVRLQDDAIADQANRAAARAFRVALEATMAEVLNDWEDHSIEGTQFKGFVASRMAEVVAKLIVGGRDSWPVLTLWCCLRNPERFCCHCGASLRNAADIDAGRCLRCKETEVVL